MRSISNMLSAAQKIDLNFLFEDSMHDTAPEYVQLQKDQMYAGIKSDDSQINRIGAPYQGYAPATIKAKIKKGQISDHVTLSDTTDFYQGIFAESRAEGFFVDSLDSKSAKLQEDYGPSIFGLGTVKKAEYVSDVQPVFLNKLVAKLNIGVNLPIQKSVAV